MVLLLFFSSGFLCAKQSPLNGGLFKKSTSKQSLKKKKVNVFLNFLYSDVVSGGHLCSYNWNLIARAFDSKSMS